MVNTSLDLLYIILALSIMLVAIFFSVTLIYLILILRDAAKVTEKTRETAEVVHEYLMKPVAMIQSIRGFISPVIDQINEKREEVEETIEDKIEEATEKAKKSKKKKKTK